MPEMNVLCEVDSDCNEGLFGLREVGEVDGEESYASLVRSAGR